MSLQEYEGCNFLRQRLLLSTLSGVPIKITNIRCRGENPGMLEYEVELLQLLEKMTNGSKTNISVTGTAFVYRPGILVGGHIDHSCNTQRGIGYVLELVLPLIPFCKKPTTITFNGITNGLNDPSVDLLKGTSLPLLAKFGISDEVTLEVKKRGMPPDGGGQAVLHCPNVKKLRFSKFTDQGKVKRIRGVAYSCRVSPQISNQLVAAARSVLNKFIPDIYIYTDHRKGDQAGKSPGYGIVLIAETTEGAVLAAEANSLPRGTDNNMTAEDVGILAANYLLDEVYKGGCADTVNQSLVAIMMTLCEPNVVKFCTGPFTPYTVQCLRHIKDFYNIMFKLETVTSEEGKSGSNIGASKVLLTCVGVGFSNYSKTAL